MVSFWENIKKAFTVPAGGPSSNFVIFKVKCDKCNEEITVRANRSSDISRVYEGESLKGAEYFLRKEILGAKCNNLMYINVYFGPDFNIISKEITGGKFVE